MKTNLAAAWLIAIITVFILQQPCPAISLFEMKIASDSIYTPGKINMTIKLTDEAKVKGTYQFLISIYARESLVRKQTIETNREKPAVFELDTPQTPSKTDVLCRVELFLDSQLIEGKEAIVTLWPPLEPYPKAEPQKAIWVFDTSGKLQKFFEKLDVAIIDATFQAVRDFVKPDIIFIGQNIDPNNIEALKKRLASTEAGPVIICLKQKQMAKDSGMKIIEEKMPDNVVCDFNTPMLDGLNALDMMKLFGEGSCIKIKRAEQKEQQLISFVTQESKDRKNLYSYLMTSKEAKGFTIYCQLASDDASDPRYEALLKNLLRYAEQIIKSRE